MLTTTLFVYGTLRMALGHELGALLARNAEYLGEATTEGRLWDLGAYPGLTAGGGIVHGELYRVFARRWGTVLSILDRYEGCAATSPEPHDYERVLIEVRNALDEPMGAWAWLLRRSTAGLVAIPSGDYVAWRRLAAVSS